MKASPKFHYIGPGQIKAARALLDWSQGDLAGATGLSITTIRNLESGDMSPRSATAQLIFQIIEGVGIEFTEGEGVRRRNDEIRVLRGSDSCEVVFDDIMQIIRKHGGEVAILIRTQNMLAQTFNLTHLEELSGVANVKCLLSENPNATFAVPSIQFKVTAKQNISPLPCIIYDDKYALALLDGAVAPRFVLFKSPGVAHSYRDHFLSLWENASLPIKAGR